MNQFVELRIIILAAFEDSRRSFSCLLTQTMGKVVAHMFRSILELCIISIQISIKESCTYAKYRIQNNKQLYSYALSNTALIKPTTT